MQLTFPQIASLAAGRWEQIHRSLGVALFTTSHQKHTPCPGCGGRDRFRVTKAYHDTGGFICGGGGDTAGGDGFALLQHVHGWTPGESLRAVARECGLDVEAAEIDYAELDRRRRIAEAQAKKAAEIRAAEQARQRQDAVFRVRHYLKVGTRPRYHPYLDSKMLAHAHNLIEYKDQLIVTTHNSIGELTGCQKIAADGSKLFLPGQEKKGSWHWLQVPPHRGQPVAVVEGWATGASLVEPEIGFTGAVAIAFDAGNIPTVTASLLTLYPSSRIAIYRDFDKAGIQAANAAVTLDPSRVTVMEPPADAPTWATDWNDYIVFGREKDID
jgi:putative DNA primase/helicase